MALAFNTGTPSPAHSADTIPPPVVEQQIDKSLTPKPAPDWNAVVTPLLVQRDKQLAEAKAAKEAADAKAAADALAAQQAQEQAATPAYSPPNAYQPQAAYFMPGGSLSGSYGYALAGGNCVDEPGVNNPRDGSNPISWQVLYAQPFIGATFLWQGNHTGIVTGLWSNGDVEVRHRNFSGGMHRFPRSYFRGYR